MPVRLPQRDRLRLIRSGVARFDGRGGADARGAADDVAPVVMTVTLTAPIGGPIVTGCVTDQLRRRGVQSLTTTEASPVPSIADPCHGAAAVPPWHPQTRRFDGVLGEADARLATSS